MPDLLIRTVATGFVTTVFIALSVFALGLALEYIAPAQKHRAHTTTRLNISYAVFFALVQSMVGAVLVAIPVLGISSLGGGLITLPGHGMVVILSVIVYVVIIDFLHYVFHRAQHACAILWAMHSLHHTDRTLNVTTTTRHHWLDIWINGLLIYPFVGFLVDVPYQAVVVQGLIGYYNYFTHCNLRISFGRFSNVLNSPQYHRIHHSDSARHQGKNFAALFPVFDMIFGTYCQPGAADYPRTGIREQHGPSGILDAIMWPYSRPRIGPVLQEVSGDV